MKKALLKMKKRIDFSNRVEAQDMEEYDDLDDWWPQEDFNIEELVRLTGNNPSAHSARSIEGDLNLLFRA